mmetsp:Transcript_32363/g.77693  ORF Transcript_32363/g.77693 Transcript_32363/m.77693 type:complete len:267 (-) Transcript_32363:1115-1915(-)
MQDIPEGAQGFVDVVRLLHSITLSQRELGPLGSGQITQMQEAHRHATETPHDSQGQDQVRPTAARVQLRAPHRSVGAGGGEQVLRLFLARYRLATQTRHRDTAKHRDRPRGLRDTLRRLPHIHQLFWVASEKVTYCVVVHLNNRHRDTTIRRARAQQLLQRPALHPGLLCGPVNSEGLAGAGLPVGEDHGGESVEGGPHQPLYFLVHLRLLRRNPEHFVERELHITIELRRTEHQALPVLRHCRPVSSIRRTHPAKHANRPLQLLQ